MLQSLPWYLCHFSMDMPFSDKDLEEQLLGSRSHAWVILRYIVPCPPTEVVTNMSSHQQRWSRQAAWRREGGMRTWEEHRTGQSEYINKKKLEKMEVKIEVCTIFPKLRMRPHFGNHRPSFKKAKSQLVQGI